MINKYFISFEGGEGAGKSTQIKLLKKKLSKYLDVKITREPGGSISAELIRSLLVKGKTNKWSALSEVLLNFAARHDHLEKVIIPNLMKNKCVISDRFTDSTYVYQGYGKGIDLKLIKTLEKLITKKIRPSITILLNINPKIGLRRSDNGINKETRYEKMSIKYHKKINSSFLKIAKIEKKRFLIVDAALSKNEIANIIWEKVSNKLNIKE